MKRFKLGQRVLVFETKFGGPIRPIAGTVVRLRHADNGAWIELDEHVGDAHHPFPVGDRRERHTMAYPGTCSLYRERKDALDEKGGDRG